MKTIEMSTGYLGEENTLKVALTHLLKEQQDTLKSLKKDNPTFVPNQHLYVAHIRNCKSLLKKL
jgi:hypothetical protein